MERIGKRPMRIEDGKGRIRNSNIEDARADRSSMIQLKWVDEIMTEVTEMDKSCAKVAISRKVLELRTNQRGQQEWANVASNGKLERWVLTQIENEIKKGPERSNNSQVEAQPPSRNAEPMTSEKQGFTFILDRCRKSGGLVICTLNVTSNDQDRELEQGWCPGGCKSQISDNLGNTFGVKPFVIGNRKLQ